MIMDEVLRPIDIQIYTLQVNSTQRYRRNAICARHLDIAALSQLQRQFSNTSSSSNNRSNDQDSREIEDRN